jgi:hypothetical protein
MAKPICLSRYQLYSLSIRANSMGSGFCNYLAIPALTAQDSRQFAELDLACLGQDGAFVSVIHLPT